MCDEAVDDSLAAFKINPDWFVTSEMIKKLHIALYLDKNIFYLNGNSDNVIFCCDEMGIFSTNISFCVKIILIIILMKVILILLFVPDFWLGILNFKKALKRKVSAELIPIAWHPKI